MIMIKTVFLAFAILLLTNLFVDCQKVNYSSCTKNEECASKNCEGSQCRPMKCRNDKACLQAGLFDHYCRRRGPKIFASECVPKRGN